MERTHGWWNAGYGIPYVTFTLCNVGSWKVGGWKVGIGMVVIVLVTFALITITHMRSRHRLGIPNAINERVIPNKSINTKYPVRERVQL